MTAKRSLTVLILGGYGTFGGRLATRLAGEDRLTLIIAGRSLTKASQFCATLPQGATLRAACVDRDGDIERHINALRPDLLIDATGPFQAFEADPYRVVQACVTLGIHYLDLADGSDFVAGIRRWNAPAEDRAVFVLSGVSTFPALSGALVRHLAEDLASVERITMAVAPSPFATVGPNVIRAIASYAGKPLEIRRHGRQAAVYALMDTRRRTIAPPGALPLGSRRFSLVDVPDHGLFPARLPGLRDIWVGAGTLPAVLHRGLNLAAWAVRLGLVPSLLPAAGLFWRVTNSVRWGEDRGGFLIEVAGRSADGTEVEHSWHIVVHGQDGPAIPCLAAEAVVRNALAERWPAPGARPADGALALADIAPLLTSLRALTGRRLRSPATGALPLYQRILGEAWERLPQALRDLHGTNAARRFSGLAHVERGNGLLAHVVASAVGFPRAGQKVSVSVDFDVRDGTETWRRTFAGRSFTSRQSEGQGRFEHLVVEAFGPFSIGLALVIEGGRLRIVVRRWSCCGVPLPSWLAPKGETSEREEDGRFHFHVEIATRFTGLIVRYRGWLVATPPLRG